MKNKFGKLHLTYRGYTAEAYISFDDNVLYGKLILKTELTDNDIETLRVTDVTDSVMFEGSTPNELVKEFENCVDDYIEFLEKFKAEKRHKFNSTYKKLKSTE